MTTCLYCIRICYFLGKQPALYLSVVKAQVTEGIFKLNPFHGHLITDQQTDETVWLSSIIIIPAILTLKATYFYGSDGHLEFSLNAIEIHRIQRIQGIWKSNET